MRKLYLMLPLALLALALGLVACGGSEESDEDKIVEVIETSVTSNDPANCEALATQDFLEQTELSKGEEAVKSCEENTKEEGPDDADSVEVSKVEVDGSSATADVAFVGGNFDGQALSVALVEEDGDWKLDEVVRFAKFDKQKLVSSLEESFRSDESIDPEVITCFGEILGESPQSEIEEVFFGGDPELITLIVEACTGEEG